MRQPNSARCHTIAISEVLELGRQRIIDLS